MEIVVQWILALVSGVLTVAMTIIGFFLRDFIAQVKRIADSQHGIDRVCAMYGEQFNMQRERNETVNSRLNDHGKRLDEHEKDIAVIKSHVKA